MITKNKMRDRESETWKDTSYLKDTFFRAPL